MTDFSIPSGASADELRQLALAYNWDDGFALPARIIEHANCDLAVALEIFWLADAATVYLGDARQSPLNAEWHRFAQTLAKQILEGRYVAGHEPFQPPLTKVQVYKLRKRGLPEVFLTGSQTGLQ